MRSTTSGCRPTVEHDRHDSVELAAGDERDLTRWDRGRQRRRAATAPACRRHPRSGDRAKPSAECPYSAPSGSKHDRPACRGGQRPRVAEVRGLHVCRDADRNERGRHEAYEGHASPGSARVDTRRRRRGAGSRPPGTRGRGTGSRARRGRTRTPSRRRVRAARGRRSEARERSTRARRRSRPGPRCPRTCSARPAPSGRARTRLPAAGRRS